MSFEIEGPSTIYLPESLVIKFEKKEQTDEEVIHEDSKQLVSVDNKVLNSNTEPDNRSRLFVNISYAFFIIFD
jgi:hypothetical protein